jgi:hypothetical protein
VRYENGGYAGCREFAVGIPDCSSHIGWESRHRSVMISGRRLYADRHVDDAQCRTGLILLELFELAEIGSSGRSPFDLNRDSGTAGEQWQFLGDSVAG